MEISRRGRRGVCKWRIAVPLSQPSISPYLRKSQLLDCRLDGLQTAVVGATVYPAYSWVVDGGEIGRKLVGLLEAVGGEGDIGGEVGGRGDGGFIGSGYGVEGEVCAELEGVLGYWGLASKKEWRGKDKGVRRDVLGIWL